MYSPWKINSSDFPKNDSWEGKITFLLKYGILAPSSHNMQPWKFRVLENKLFIYLDPQKKLTFSDRADRQGYLSLGCAIGNILLSADYFGLNYKLEIFPEWADEDIVAAIIFGNEQEDIQLGKYKHLFEFITKRSTNRFRHKKQNISSEIIKEVEDIGNNFNCEVKIVQNEKDIKKLATVVSQATGFAFSKRIFREELSKWVISVYSHRKDGIPLYDFDLPHPLTIFASKLIKYAKADQQQAIDYKNISESQALLVISSKGDLKENWIISGIVYELVSLLCAKFNISLAPYGAAIEHEATRYNVSKIVKVHGYPEMFTRMGYSLKSTVHSPRRSLSDVLL